MAKERLCLCTDILQQSLVGDGVSCSNACAVRIVLYGIQFHLLFQRSEGYRGRQDTSEEIETSNRIWESHGERRLRDGDSLSDDCFCFDSSNQKYQYTLFIYNNRWILVDEHRLLHKTQTNRYPGRVDYCRRICDASAGRRCGGGYMGVSLVGDDDVPCYIVPCPDET